MQLQNQNIALESYAIMVSKVVRYWNRATFLLYLSMDDIEIKLMSHKPPPKLSLIAPIFDISEEWFHSSYIISN